MFCATWRFAVLSESFFLHWHSCHRLCNERGEEFYASSDALTTHWEKNHSHIKEIQQRFQNSVANFAEVVYVINAFVFFFFWTNSQLNLGPQDSVTCPLKPDLKWLLGLLLLVGKCPSNTEECHHAGTYAFSVHMNQQSSTVEERNTKEVFFPPPFSYSRCKLTDLQGTLV